jgi:hypothetical protein
LQMRLKRGKQFFYITKLIHNGTGIWKGCTLTQHPQFSSSLSVGSLYSSCPGKIRSLIL